MDTAALRSYQAAGHLTVAGVFDTTRIDAVVRDIEQWGEQFLASLPPEKRGWYLDHGPRRIDPNAREVLRKLDNPHAHREAVLDLARDPKLVAMVEAIIGAGVSVYFSQIFFKPPEGGGPKPAHQDNFYFGPSDPDGLVTAWIAFDGATLENGCMYFGEGGQNGPVYAHVAPPDEPFNLQLTDADLALQTMVAAPVPKGGVSFHHGVTVHQSGPNLSSKWRRACALHYVRNDVEFVAPALPYDRALKRRISGV